MPKRKIEVEVIADSSRFSKGLKRASGDLSTFGRVTSKGKATFGLFAKGAGLAGVAAVSVGGKLVSLASDAEETASKFKTVFGKEAANATKRLDEFSKATGTSKFALREQAAQFQALIRPMGLANERAAGMSVGMTKLATDLASFNNSSVEEAITALQSGLVGEAEPLRRFGVQLSANRVETYAYAKGIAKQGEELTAAQKAQASYGIILEDTKLAQGDATRTADSFANQWKRLKNQGLDLATSLGVKVLPAATAVVGAITEFIAGMRSGEGAGGRFVAALTNVARAAAGVVNWFRQNETVTIALGAAVATLFATYGAYTVFTAASSAMAALRATTVGTAFATGGLTAAMTALKVAMLAHPFVLVGVALAALVGGIVVAYKKSETFREIVTGAFNAIKTTATSVFGWLRAAVVNVVDFLKARWENVKTGVTFYWNSYRTLIINPIRSAFDWLREAVRNVADWLGARWGDIKSTANAAWDAVKRHIVEPIREAAGAVRGALGGEGLLGWLRERFEDFKNVAERLARPFVNAFGNIADQVKKVLNFLGDIIDRVKSVIDFLGKIKVPKINLPFFGGEGNGKTVGPTRPGSVDSFNGLAASFGNVVTSGYRPGDDGWHGQNRARDYAGGNMLGFARAMLAYAPMLLELIHSPLGVGVKNGQIVSARWFGSDVYADHFDHVHVAMKNGGKVRRGGWALVGEEGPELARLPTGTRVHSHGESKAMLGNGVTINYNGTVNIGSRKAAEVQANKLAYRISHGAVPVG